MALGVVAFVAAAILTPVVRRWAIGQGFVDKPGGHSTHDAPIALGGGIVIFWISVLPLVIGLTIAFVWNKHGSPDWLPASLEIHLAGLVSRWQMVVVLVLSAAMLHGLGLIDDRVRLGPWLKLGVQVAVASSLAILGDIRFTFFLDNTLVTTILSILWIVVIINAFNFLDNMDGLSAGIGIISGALILAAAISNGQVFVGGLLALLVGSLLGFLVFNFHPAKIYLGDGGSLLIGLLIAVLTIRTTYFHEASASGRWYGTMVPLLVLAVPLYDFVSVVLLRLKSGVSPFVGDNRHFSHRLIRLGLSRRNAVLTIYLATACTGLGATFLHQVSPAGATVILIQAVLIILIIAILEYQGQLKDK